VISFAAMQFEARRALEHADMAVALLERLGDRADPAILAGGLAVRVRAGAVLGLGLDRELMDRALALEAGLPPEDTRIDHLSPVFGFWLRWFDDLDASRRMLEALIRDATASGHDTTRAVGLMQLSVTESRAGNLQHAHELARSAFVLAEELGAHHLAMLTTHALLLAEANLGSLDEARTLAERLRPLASGSGGGTIELESALGLLELSRGDYEAANRHLEAALEVFERVGFGEPGQFRVHADAAEAAVALRDLGRATRIADLLQGHGERTNHRWSLATGARVRALIAAADGDLDAALEACERALHYHEGLTMPIELGRTLLVKGVLKRRARRRAAAKTCFE
jgi:tetratricopeptide (TPR) repeat protein